MQEHSDSTSAAANGDRSVVDEEDTLAGYVDVNAQVESATEDSTAGAPAANRFASPTLRTVQVAGRVDVVIISPTTDEIPVALPEESFPSPRRRVTPTSRRRQSYQVTYEDLVSRPRSNPRSRTPMRYESPLEHNAFIWAEEGTSAQQQDTFQPRTISIRPGAGLGVGVVRPVPERNHFDDRTQRPEPIIIKSQKQGPSQRKAHRWNNDNFVNSFHDLANSHSAKSRAAAEVLAQAKADAHRFLPVYDPAETARSAQVTRFMEDQRYKDVRERFFSGELHASTMEPKQGCNNKPKQPLANPSASDLFERIDVRLRRVVVKACENSAPACKVVESFESFLVHSFSNDHHGDETSSIPNDFWHGILLKKPSVQQWQGKSEKAVFFLFDGDSSSGGFHRLLVHAVCHFHCLRAKTSSLEEGHAKGRALLVDGSVRGIQHRLLDHLVALQEQKQGQ